MTRVNQWTLLTYSFGIGALALLPFQLSQPPLQITDRSAVAAFAGYVLIAAIAGYGAYTAALRYLQASVAFDPGFNGGAVRGRFRVHLPG